MKVPLRLDACFGAGSSMACAPYWSIEPLVGEGPPQGDQQQVPGTIAGKLRP